jgi:phenylalanyl-tRNA synthetase alpha chain
VRVDDVELEIGECGLAHPEVLRGCGLPAEASGLAMGLGLDRLTMLAKGIDDIRLLRSADPRVAKQMCDLKPYRPVSTMPAARRDLSVAVPDALDAELLGDRVRTILGTEALAVEEVIVLSETAYVDLPESARARLGMSPEHKNVLLRLIFRDLDRTLSSAQANRLRDLVYAGLHVGSAAQWASDPRESTAAALSTLTKQRLHSAPTSLATPSVATGSMVAQSTLDNPITTKVCTHRG